MKDLTPPLEHALKACETRETRRPQELHALVVEDASLDDSATDVASNRVNVAQKTLPEAASTTMLPTPERLTLTLSCTPDTYTKPVPLFSTVALPRLPRHTMLPVLQNQMAQRYSKGMVLTP